MIRNCVRAVVLVALSLIALPVISLAAPTAAKQWSVANTNQISYETDYVLYNMGSQLGYDNRTFGIDLGRGVKGGFFALLR